MLARGVYPLDFVDGVVARAVNDRPYRVVNFVLDMAFPVGL